MAPVEVKEKPPQTPENLNAQISQSYRVLKEVSQRLEGLKNGHKPFNEAVLRVGENFEVSCEVITVVPQVLWENLSEKTTEDDNRISSDIQRQEFAVSKVEDLVSLSKFRQELGHREEWVSYASRELGIEMIKIDRKKYLTCQDQALIREWIDNKIEHIREKNRKRHYIPKVPQPKGSEPIKHKDNQRTRSERRLTVESAKKDTVGLISISQISDLLQVPTKNLQKDLRNLGIEIINAVDDRYHFIRAVDFLKARDLIKSRKLEESQSAAVAKRDFFNKPIPVDTDAPEGALSYWRFRSVLGRDELWFPMAKRELEIQPFRIGNKSYLTAEDQALIKQKIEQIKESVKNTRLKRVGERLIYKAARRQIRTDLREKEKIEKEGETRINEKLSAMARLALVSRYDQEERAARLSNTGGRKQRRVAKESVVGEAPEGYMSLAEAWNMLGINAGDSSKIQRTYDLPFIKIGTKKYFEKASVIDLKNVMVTEPEVVKVPKIGRRREKVKTSFSVIGLGEEWVSSNEAIAILEISLSSLDNILRDEQEQLTINKIGGRNYFARDEIMMLKDNRVERVKRNGFNETRLEVKDVDRGEAYRAEDAGSLDIYFKALGDTQFTHERNVENSKKILEGEIALYQLKNVLEITEVSEEIKEELEKPFSLPEGVKEEIENLLSQRKAKFLLKRFITSINYAGEKSEINGYKKLNREAKVAVKNILETIENAKDEVITDVLKSRMDSAKLAFGAHDELVGDNLKLAANRAKIYRGRGLPYADLIGFANEGLNTAAARYNWGTGNAFSTYATWWIDQSIRRGLATDSRNIRLPNHIHELLYKISKIRNDLWQKLGRPAQVAEICKEAGISTRQYKGIMNSVNVDSLNRAVSMSDGDELELGDLVAAESDEEIYDLAERNALREEMTKALGRVLNGREKRVIEMRFGIKTGKPMLLEEIGNDLGVTRERVRQIEEKALKKLRHPSIIKKLKAFL